MRIILLDSRKDAQRDGLQKALSAAHPKVRTISQDALVVRAADFASNFDEEDTFVFKLNLRPPGSRSPEALRRFFEVQEWHNLMIGLSRALPERQFYNHPLNALVAGSKPLQIMTAARIGFRTPRTLITNDRAEAMGFVDGVGAAVVKPIDTTVTPNPQSGDDTLLLFTRPISRKELEAEGSLAPGGSPVILQERVAKRHELRLVVHGAEGTCIRIDSQRHAGSSVDWRWRQGDAGMFEPVDTDPTLLALARAYLDELGLQAGVFDLAVEPSGEIVFFECNVNGQWGWLDDLVGGRIKEQAVADVYAFATRNRRSPHRLEAA